MRIGFVLSDLYSGSSSAVWSSVALSLRSEGSHNLLILPCGRSGSPENYICGRIKDMDFDGLILRASSLSENSDVRSIASSIDGGKKIPAVIIGGSRNVKPEYPVVSFDLLSGVRAAVRFFLEKKSAEFAFIRGPENNNLAENRYRAFLSVLRENNVDWDLNRVSSPVLWNEGDVGMRELLEKRHLVPGKDFKVLFCANDYILSKALKVAESYGYESDCGFAACAFNDFSEFSVFTRDVSSIELPYGLLGKTAVEKLVGLISGKVETDVVLPTEFLNGRNYGAVSVFPDSGAEMLHKYSLFIRDLIEADSAEAVCRALENHASDLGFERLVLCPEGRRGLPEETAEGIWIVSPLCRENKPMGLLLMKPQVLSGFKCENIRSVVSAALNSVLLSERLRNEEQLKIRFFTNAGMSLKKPLKKIRMLAADFCTDERTREDLSAVLKEADSTLDLALDSIGGFEIRPHIVNPEKILMQFPCYHSNGKLVCLNLDEEKIKAALEVFVLNSGPAAVMKVEITNRGVRIDIEGRGTDEADDKLAGKIIYMHGGSCRYGDGCVSVVLPYPTLSGESAAAESADGWKEDMPVLAIGGFPPFSIGKTTGFSSENGLPRFAGAVFWNEDFYGQKASAVLSMLVSDPYYRKLPFLCCSCPQALTMEASMWALTETARKGILVAGTPSAVMNEVLGEAAIRVCGENNVFDEMLRDEVRLVVFTKADDGMDFIMKLKELQNRFHRVQVVCVDRMESGYVSALAEIPDTIVVHGCFLESREFVLRLRAIAKGSPVLPVSTGKMVKNAQLYICSRAVHPVTRRQISESVHVSPDYLSRIFKNELGLSLWDYLSRYRVFLAQRLLSDTGLSVNEIAVAAGFQNQAYFCRMFRKIRNENPVSYRRNARNAKGTENNKYGE